MKEEEEEGEGEVEVDFPPPSSLPPPLLPALADTTSRALVSSQASETPSGEEAAPAAVALRVMAAVP